MCREFAQCSVRKKVSGSCSMSASRSSNVSSDRDDLIAAWIDGVVEAGVAAHRHRPVHTPRGVVAIRWVEYSAGQHRDELAHRLPGRHPKANHARSRRATKTRLISRTHDISTGLGIPFDPPRESLQSAAHTRATGPRTRSSRLTTADPTSEPAAVGLVPTDQEFRYRSSTSCMCNRLASWRGLSRRPSNPLDFIPSCTRPTFS